MAEERCWVSVDKTSGSGNSSFHIIFDKNLTDEDQKAVVEIVSEDGKVIKEVEVRQSPRVVYYSALKQKIFTRDNCTADQKGTDILYVIPAGKYKSFISQEDADAQAEQDLLLNGQDYANAEGECETFIWYNKRASKTLKRNNCPSGIEGSSVEYVVEAGKHVSYVSQEDADMKAQLDIEENAQNYANEHGTCTTIYYSKKVEGTFTKNNCPSGQVPQGEFPYEIEAGKFTSTISQEDADAKAQSELNKLGQENANKLGTCLTIYYNARKSGMFRKNDCESGSGTMVEYVVEAGTITSTISQLDADQKAAQKVQEEGQAYANEHGTCDSAAFVSKEIRVELQKNNCEEGVGETGTYVVPEGKYQSDISQEDADAKAQADADANAQNWVNENVGCIITYQSEEYRKTFTKNDCPESERGSEVEYIVEAGAFTSTISQEDANAKAVADAEEKGQTYANENGTCIAPFLNVEKSRNFTKQDCVAPQKGSSVKYTVPAGKYSSFESQEAADALAEADIEANGQEYANTHGECLDMFVNAEISKEFQKSDCAGGMIGSKVVYTVESGKYASDVSQEEADAQAEADIEENGPSYANKNGECLYGNDELSQDFTKECPDGQKGSVVTYTVPANKYTAKESKEAANALAQAEIDEKGQAYANQNGSCQDLFVNSEISDEFQKNDCTDGMVGSKVTYTVEAGKYTSSISKEDADAKAQKDLTDNGQAYANKNGTCLYGNDRKAQTFTKVCPEGEQGTEVEYVVEANTFTSSESKAAANALADADIAAKGQEYANTHGQCQTIYYNVRKSKKFTRNNCSSSQTGSEVEYVVEAGTYQSVISQADADAKADADITEKGQDYANTHGTCLYLSAQKSGTYYKNDCGSCKHGTAYVYTVEAGKYTSEVSQADADQKAQNDVNTNGQAAANKNGSCAADSTTPTWTDTGSTKCNGCTSQKEQKDTNPCSSSYNTTKWINGGGRSCSNWTYYGTGDCVGNTRYDAYKDTCTGEIDNQYTVDCYDCCNCGSYGSWSEDGCSGTSVLYERYDSCGNRDTKTEQVCGKCGYTGGSMSGTSNYRCQGGVSQRQYTNDCGGSEWRNEGTACTATNTNQPCVSGCKCETCIYPGEYSANGSTTSAAQQAANDKATAAFAALGGKCKSEYWNTNTPSVTKTRNNCGSGCTGTSVTYTVPAGKHWSCISQSQANQDATDDANDNAQSYANENGKCNCSGNGVLQITVSTNAKSVRGILSLNGPTSGTIPFEIESSPGYMVLKGFLPGTYSVSASDIYCRCKNQVGEYPAVHPIVTSSVTIPSGGKGIIVVQESCGCTT